MDTASPSNAPTSHDIRVTLAEAYRRLSKDAQFMTFFERPNEITVELYSPIGSDSQTPHDRDELYIVVHGSGIFRRADERVGFGPGDLLYVPAHISHCFENFSADFKVWVIFFGKPQGAIASAQR